MYHARRRRSARKKTGLFMGPRFDKRHLFRRALFSAVEQLNRSRRRLIAPIYKTQFPAEESILQISTYLRTHLCKTCTHSRLVIIQSEQDANCALAKLRFQQTIKCTEQVGNGNDSVLINKSFANASTHSGERELYNPIKQNYC